MLRCDHEDMPIYMKEGGAGFAAGTMMHRPGGLCHQSFFHISLWSAGHDNLYAAKQSTSL